ncbi:MAG: hypothetical protein M3Y43_01815 [Pseudomonadota bacterium]|nr:hypothetical protein [Pseudomonadota bacterium]MDQ2703882.1 hypothetical protein [Pseudomonadota bacterium]
MTGTTDKDIDSNVVPRRRVRLFGRTVPLPNSRPVRMTIGSLLIVFGIFGFLPVLGFWMVPLGALVLSHDLAWARRYRRRFEVWWEKRRRRNGAMRNGR